MSDVRFRILRACVCFSFFLVSATTNAQWVKPPSEDQLKKTPGLTHHTLDSASMKTAVGYSVVLPPGYENSQDRYPVVYWLHGGGGNESSSLFTAQSWRDLEQSEAIRPVILVYPNGFRSGYMDHHDGRIMIESLIIKELIPFIDANYRTIASREGRAVHGFSMGSTGALKFAFKYPDLFCAAVAYGGGEVDLATTKSKFIRPTGATSQTAAVGRSISPAHTPGAICRIEALSIHHLLSISLLI